MKKKIRFIYWNEIEFVDLYSILFVSLNDQQSSLGGG